MEIMVRLDGGKKVSAAFAGYRVETDQPAEAGGEGSAPAPFDLFLASLATCAGFFVQSFCQKRGLSTDGITIAQRSHRDEATHMVTKITLEIGLPPGFPEKYRAAVLAAASQCTVKKHLQSPPQLEISAI